MVTLFLYKKKYENAFVSAPEYFLETLFSFDGQIHGSGWKLTFCVCVCRGGGTLSPQTQAF